MLRRYHALSPSNIPEVELDELMSYVEPNANPMHSPDAQMHACLQCSFVGALHACSPDKPGFIKHSFQTDHFLGTLEFKIRRVCIINCYDVGLHILRDEMYCALCRDYVYDIEFDRSRVAVNGALVVWFEGERHD